MSAVFRVGVLDNLSFYNRCDILTNLQLIDEGEA
jgi:hypothetical protein